MPLDFDGLNKKKNERVGFGWSPDPGDNDIRVLPPTSDYFTDMIAFIAEEYRNHFVRLDGRDLEVFRCLRDFDEKCPACAFHYDHKNDKDEDVAEVAKKFRPSTRFAFNIIDMAEPGAGIQTYECGPSVHNEILKYAANEQWGDVLNPEEGRNFTVTLTPANQSKTGYNSYDVMPSPQQTSVLHHLPEDWKEQLDALAGDVPERPDSDRVRSFVSEAEGRAFGRSGNATAAPTSASTPETEPEPQGTGFSPDVSEPQDDVPDGVSPDTGEVTHEAETTDSGNLPPRVEGGPEIDPDTGEPVCFGDFDRTKYPCDNCDSVSSCQVRKLDL